MYYLKEEYYRNFQESGTEEEDENEPLSQDNSVSWDNNGLASDNSGIFNATNGANVINGGIQKKKLNLQEETCKLLWLILSVRLLPLNVFPKIILPVHFIFY